MPHVGEILVGGHARSEFTDVAKWVRSPIHVKSTRPVQVVPLGFVFPVGIEHLYAVILPIRDVNISILVGTDIVNEIELARLRARLAPRKEKLAVR